MRQKWAMIAAVLAVSLAWCEDQPQGTLLLPCATDGPTQCAPSRKDAKTAQKLFEKALKFQKEKRLQEAFDGFETAARLSPQNVDYVTAREMMRQQLVFHHVQQGNQEMRDGRRVEALGEFRAALNLDPENQFALERMQDAAAEWAPKTAERPQILADAGPVEINPKADKKEFHFRGDSRNLLTQVAQNFGIAATIDESVASRKVRFDIDAVDFYTAMRAACAVTRTFWTPLGEKQILLALDSAENHRQYDQMSLRTFYLPGVTAPQDLTEIVNLLRNLFEVRFITPQPRSSTLTLRAPQRTLEAATQFLEGLNSSRPQVMLDITVYEISHTVTRDMGLQIPNQFQLFNIPLGALAALGGQNIQDLINQLIANGGINQANSTALSALLAQLQGQQNSIFSQPIATFGNGKTLMGLSLGTAGAKLSLNESTAKILEHATLRAAQGNETTFKLGSRYPILNASFAPIYNTPAISQVLQNNSYQAAFPSFNYEDIGLTMKAKPTINRSMDVALQIEMQIRTLTGTSENGVPVIANREYKGSILLRNGEPAVVAGAITRSDQHAMTGIPGAGLLPGINKITTSNSKDIDEDELLVTITPHVLNANESQTTEVWLTK